MDESARTAQRAARGLSITGAHLAGVVVGFLGAAVMEAFTAYPWIFEQLGLMVVQLCD